MARYQKGYNTGEKIYQCAKNLMYKRGYRNATIETIALKADVPVGLVNYYFKKDEILARMYKEFDMKIRSFIAENFGQAEEDLLVYRIVFNRIFFSVTLSDGKVRALFKEVFTKRLLVGDDKYFNETALMLRSLSVDITQAMLFRLITAESGALSRLLLTFYDKMDFPKDKALIDLMGCVVVSLAGVESSVISEGISKADKLLARKDIAKVGFI